MSDVSVTTAPPPASAPSTPPAQTEVRVNEAPVTTQTPLGSQAPPKPEGQESNKSSQISRREAIQNAFARSKQQQEEAVSKPKPTVRNADGADGADAKKQPQTPQHREQGRFARDPNKPQVAVAQGQQEQTPPGQQRQQIQQLDQSAPFREPPKRFDARAQAEWAKTPESVRGAVDRMTRDFQGAYEKFRGDYETMETLRPWQNLAQKQGTTLNNAFTNYYQMEQKLRGDVYGGLDLIVSNMGIKHPDGTPVTFRDIAWTYLNQTPEQHRLYAQQNQQTASDMRIGQLLQVVEKQGKQLEQIVHKQRFDATLDQVHKFAETHPRMDELHALIKQELDLGFPLEVAYQRAERLAGPSPTQAAQTRNATAQTRRTSISGAPDGGNASARPSDGQRRGNGEDKPPPTRREAIAKAMRSVRNSL